jgi:transposase
MNTPSSWPTDPRECHDLLEQLAQQVENLQAALQNAAKLHDQTTQEHERVIQDLRQQIDLYRRFLFGPRRERLVDAVGQGHLFEIAAGVLPPEPPIMTEPTAESTAARRPRGSRKPDYDRLPQVRIEHDVPEAEKCCSHCGKLKIRIGEDEARVLEFIPARFELQIHLLPKYACPRCRDGVRAPQVPARPLSGCIAGSGVLAQLIVSKFSDHLPLYRLEDISVRHGLHLPRSTLCDWVGKVAELLRPLYERQKELVQSAEVLWTDDTHVTVLGSDQPGSHKGRFWVYIGPIKVPYDVYHFTENRKRDGPAQFLANYTGYLQADAFRGYDGIFTGSEGRILEVACWAHARRKFFDARSSSLAEASLILEMIRRLYEVEDRARPLDDEARLAMRQERRQE